VSSETLTAKRSMGNLLAGMFLAPVATAVNFQTNYMLVPFACQSGWWLILNISPLIALAVGGYGLRIAWINWKAAGGEWPDEEGGVMPRNRFVGMFGILFSVASCALILMQLIPVYLMHPCVGPR
jgi:hypothetical protein